MSMQFGRAASRRLNLAEVPRESGAADRFLDNGRQMIRLDSVDDIPRNPRTAIDDAALRELADSIAEHGLLQAPVVRRSLDNPDRYLTVFGARRIAAHRLLGREEIEVIVRRLDDRHAFLASCVENVQRVQLAPREELDMIGVLVEELSSQDAAARALGKSKTWLSKRRRLLGAPAFAAAVERGELSLDHAYDVLTHAPDERAALLALERVRAGRQKQEQTRAAPSPRTRKSAVPLVSVGTEPPTQVLPERPVAAHQPPQLPAPTPDPHVAPQRRAATIPATGRGEATTAADLDLVTLSGLRILRLAQEHGPQAPRAAVLQALRADLANVEEQ